MTDVIGWHRYRVVETWGEVPEQIAEIVNKPDAYLLYPEYRGEESEQGFLRSMKHVGGWYMEFVSVVTEADGLKPADPQGDHP